MRPHPRRRGLYRCAHRSYLLSCDQYDEIRANAGFACELCREAEEMDFSDGRSTLVLDHDHALGRWAVRGLVCQGCNMRLRWPDRYPSERMSWYMTNPLHKRMGLLPAAAKREMLSRT